MAEGEPIRGHDNGKKGGPREEAMVHVCALFTRLGPETRQAIAEDIKERLLEMAAPEDRPQEGIS